jgi:hypothetical protein
MGSYKIRGSTTPNMNASTTRNDAEAPPPARVSFENAPEAAMEMSRTSAASYETRAKAEAMRYTICDVPPLSTGVLLGFQHLLTMLSATVLIPLIGKKSSRMTRSCRESFRHYLYVFVLRVTDKFLRYRAS